MNAPLVQKVLTFVDAHNGPKDQGLAMARALLPLNCDEYTLAASILYPTVAAQPTLCKTLADEFDKTISKLILGVLQMETIHRVQEGKTKNTAQQGQIDNLRKMLLAMVDDIRVVLIKLSERLEILKAHKDDEEIKQKAIAQEVMDYYVPLANRLGLGHLKWQLEDWSFRYLDPQTYKMISKALSKRRLEREELIENMITELKSLLGEINLSGTIITGRAKHIYSIHRKMHRKQVPFEQLYDTSALRILVPTIDDCYAVLGIVHARWPHIQVEFDDYIANPKPNGYQSIHTAISRSDGTPVEIQIRTFQMHEQAELGVAAHWKYKENQTAQGSYEDKIAWLRKVLDWQASFSDSAQQDDLYQQAFSDRVYVFSPAGEVFDLPAGATSLDFAYLIHTTIGHRCRGAKVNQKLVPLTQPLKTGDQVDIVTAKEENPSRDWMRPENNFLTTQHAIRKVRHWFRQLDHDKYIQSGQIAWDKAAKQKGIPKQDLTAVAKRFNFKSETALFAALGSGDLQVASILSQLHSEEKPPLNEEALIPIQQSGEANSTKQSVEFNGINANTLLTQLAKCCNPIPGDKVLGFITQGRGISIHRSDCHNILKALKEKPEKVIETAWKEKSNSTFRLQLMIEAEDRPGLLLDVSNLIKQMNLSILSLQTHVNEKKQTAHIQLVLALKEADSAKKVIQRIKQINSVIEAHRSNY